MRVIKADSFHRPALRQFGVTLGALLFAAGLIAGAAHAQQTDTVAPRLVNAHMEKRAAAGRLSAEIREFAAAQAQPAWLGYAVAALPDHGESCCWDSYENARMRGCGRCALESEKGITVQAGPPEKMDSKGEAGGTVHLEGSGALIVMLRAADHRIEKVRAFSEDCEIDAGGVRVVWLTGVTGAESVAALAPLVTGADFDSHDGRQLAEGAMAAIAMHADPAADRALASFTEPSRPEKLRSQAAFWLGNSRGDAGLAVLEKMAKSDPSDHVRSQVSFALSQNGSPRAIDDMIRMAHDDQSGHVRGQAMFWLAQKAGKKAAGAITDAIENDPDTATKKAAVFALTQMPADEGVPLLIQVAKTNKNPVVRKQAFFWLGQSKDPRALAFFEQVLSR